MDLPSLYDAQYHEAVAHFRADEFDQCIRLTKHNLSDPSLSRYHRMKNLILLASVEDNWYPVRSWQSSYSAPHRVKCALLIFAPITWQAERYRLQAEQIWYTTNRLLNDEESKAALQQLRSDLDELKGTQEADAPDEVDHAILFEREHDDALMDEDEAVDMEEQWFEDPEEVRAAEEEAFGPDINVIAALHDAVTAETELAPDHAGEQAKEPQVEDTTMAIPETDEGEAAGHVMESIAPTGSTPAKGDAPNVDSPVRTPR